MGILTYNLDKNTNWLMDIKTTYQFWDPIPRFRCQSIEICHNYVTIGCNEHKYILDSSLF